MHPSHAWARSAVSIAGFAVAAVFGGEASAERPSPAAVEDPAVAALGQLSLQKATLDNGLRVVMNVDRSTPTVAVCVTYDVGSRNEERGKSGFAHLFEHIMFQGSRNVPKGEHFKLISARGGTLNGTTSPDRTNYYEMLPMNELALGLWLEADRMRWLDVTTENFENQRRVVQEEYRMRVSNAAYMQGLLRLRELAFADYWPYGHDAIGSMTDLDNARFEWVKDFHASYYAPNNAVLTIAGNFDTDEAMRLVREYFGPIPAQPDVPPYAPGEAPEQTAERSERLSDPNAHTPGLFYGFRIAKTRTPEHYALELAALLLADGESSRLYRTLVRERAVAREVTAWTEDQRGPDLLTLMVLLTEKADLKSVRQLVDREIGRLAERPPSAAELDKVKNRLRSSFIFGIQSNLNRAVRLGEFEVHWGDARLLTRELDHYLAVSPQAVSAAVKQYLIPARRSTIEVMPPGGAQAALQGAAR